LSKLPTQLKWSIFVAALKALKYKQLPSKGGSARHFQRGNEDPVTFHQPHGNDTLKQGTLAMYMRFLDTDIDKFLAAVDGERKNEETLDERFRRTLLGNGSIISHCCECCNPVITSFDSGEIEMAELSHVCP
jgi:hypothetical protein